MLFDVECIETNIILSRECFNDLISAQNSIKHNISDLFYQDYLNGYYNLFYLLDFYKEESKLIPVMLKYKVNGYVYFDNKDIHYCLSSKYFGYDFDGNGGYKKLFGKIVFEEAR
jgi:hypothetical protein